MQLSRKQENEIVDQFRDLLRSISNRFYYVYNRRENRRFDMDDCFQEILIVFLKHLRRIESMENIYPLPFRDFKNAVCALVLRGLSVSVPRRTTDFTKLTNRVQDAGSVDEMLDSGSDFDGGFDMGYAEVEEKMAIESFMSHLSPEERDFLAICASCNTSAEAADVLGVHRSTVGRRLDALKGKYLAECA